MDWGAIVLANLKDISLRTEPFETYEMGQAQVLVADTLAGAEAAVKVVEGAARVPVFGLDMEWKPDRTSRSENKVAVIQLSAGDHVAVLHIASFGFRLPRALERRLLDAGTWFVTVAWSGDQRKLISTFPHLPVLPCGIIDLQQIAYQKGYEQCGLETLAQELLHHGYVKPPEIRVSDWEMPLRIQQVKYAALDALCSEHCYWVLCGEPWLPEGAEDDDKEAAAAAEGPLYF